MGQELDRVAMATTYRIQGDNRHSLKLSLELIRDMRSWQPEWLAIATNIAICAYYVRGAKELGRLACEALQSVRDEFVDHERVVANATWYTPHLKKIRQGKFGIGDNPYRPTNPCVCFADDGLYGVVRLVNYDQEHGRVYRSDDLDGVIKTRNLIYDDGDLMRIDDSMLRGPGWVSNSEIRGLEDVRLLRVNGKTYFTATSCCVEEVPVNVNFGKAARWPRVVIGHIEDGKFMNVRPMRAHRNTCEKNWIPYRPSGTDDLLLVYSWDPFTVLRPNVQTGDYTELWCHEPEWWAKSWRGGSQGVTSVRHVSIVHEVARRDDENVYLHRFVEWDGCHLTRYSAPFVFDHHGVEYCCGLARKRDGNYVASYGYEDREARWCEIDGAVVESMLRTPDEARLEFEMAVNAA
jgi:hypothetical protein